MTDPVKKTSGGAPDTHGTHTGSNSAVAPVVASVVLTFTRDTHRHRFRKYFRDRGTSRVKRSTVWWREHGNITREHHIG